MLKNYNKEQRLTIAVVVGTIFLTVEIIGGIVANSLAIIADAAHLFTDVFGFVIALLAIKFAKADATEQFTFGYARIEVFSAFFSILLLWGVTVGLVVEAIMRAIEWSEGRAEAVDGVLMFSVACFGIFVNICLGIVFHEDHGGGLTGHCHDHDHQEHDALLLESGDVEAQHHNPSHSHSHDHDHGHDHHHSHRDHGGASHRHDHDHDHSHSFNPMRTIDDHQHDEEHAGHGHERGHDHDRSCDQSHDHNHDHDHHSAEQSHGDHEHSHGHCPSHGSGKSPKKYAALEIDHGGHDHSHSHSHEGDVNMQAAFLHVLTDLVQSIGVAIGGAIIWAHPSWQIADAACTLLFSVLVLLSSREVLRRIFLILFEATPQKINIQRLRSQLLHLPHVVDVHDLHVWNLSSTSIILTCHMIISADKEVNEISRQAHAICDAAGIDHVTIQIQHSTEEEGTCHSSSCRLEAPKFKCHNYDRGSP